MSDLPATNPSIQRSQTAPARAGRSVGGKRVDNIREKLTNAVANGSLYEALQMIKTVHARKSSLGQHDDAAKQLIEGAIILLECKEYVAGSELGVMLINDYRSQKASVTPEKLKSIKDINSKYDPCNQQVEFLKHAIKWTADNDDFAGGDPELHFLAAITQEKMTNYEGAFKNYIRSERPRDFASMLVQWSTEGYEGEVDLYVVRAVLSLLCLKNLRDANVVLVEYKALWATKGLALETPLLNFTSFLLQTLERDALPLMELLLERYQLSIKRDPQFIALVQKIKFKFFNVRPPQQGGLMGMLSNLFN